MAIEPNSNGNLDISHRVRAQYTRAPFPPVSFFPIVTGPPREHIWLYSFTEAYYHAFRSYRPPAGRRILDAGCGTGHGIVQIRHQAPGAEVHACDFSAKSLEIARQRIAAMGEEPVTFHELNLLDLSSLPGKFDAIFCSGVVHHTADPVRALAQLKSKLKPDGVLYLMLYSQFGRRETLLMQRALKLLCQDPTDQQEGLRLGRLIFDGLPPANPIATWERVKWNNNHRQHAEAFIDMYVNANEKNYTMGAVVADLAAAGLKFLRFANAHEWVLANRMNAHPDLLARFNALPPLAQSEVMENLFPNQDQYLFFATHTENAAVPPAWLTANSLVGWKDQLTAIRSPLAAALTANPDPAGYILWTGYFGHRTRLDGSALQLLNGCAGQQSAGAIAAAWEHQEPTSRQGKGLEWLRQFEGNGLIYFKSVAAGSPG